MAQLFGDYHTHTLFSHGKGSIEANVLAAKNLGLKQIAITDHGFRHSMYNVRRCDFPFMQKEIQRLSSIHTDIDIMLGMETNIQGIDGTIDLDFSDIAKLDLIICGYHKLVVSPTPKTMFTFWLPAFCSYLFNCHTSRRRAKNTEAFINAINRYPIDIISHPGHDIDIDAVALAREMKRLGVYFELNGKNNDLPIDVMKTVADTGVEFIMNSDAHSPQRVGELSKPMAVMDASGIDFTQVANFDRLPQFRSHAWKEQNVDLMNKSRREIKKLLKSQKHETSN